MFNFYPLGIYLIQYLYKAVLPIEKPGVQKKKLFSFIFIYLRSWNERIMFNQEFNQDIFSKKKVSKEFLHNLKNFCIYILFLIIKSVLVVLVSVYFKWCFLLPAHSSSHDFFNVTLLHQGYFFFCHCYLLMCYIEFFKYKYVYSTVWKRVKNSETYY